MVGPEHLHPNTLLTQSFNCLGSRCAMANQIRIVKLRNTFIYQPRVAIA